MQCHPLRTRQCAQQLLQRLPAQRCAQVRSFSCFQRYRQQHLGQHDAVQNETATARTTNFGFSTIEASQKESKGESLTLFKSLLHLANLQIYPVGEVFSSVASKYDAMNDLMSLGVHRRWKDHFVRSVDPGQRQDALYNDSVSAQRNDDGNGNGNGNGMHILDIAGGTGDIAFRLLDHATNTYNDNHTRVTVADINPAMLAEGRKRATASTRYANSPRLSFVEANAEHLDMVEDNSVDLYTVAFGIRNFTHKDVALREAYRVLRPGGVFACLEFSKVNNRPLNAFYKRWSFGAIPLIGQIVAADRDSYQYLVESIEQFPSQEEFRAMIKDAGFLIPGQGYENLSFGIAAIHKGVKPIHSLG